jgi:hypothetical protein
VNNSEAAKIAGLGMIITPSGMSGRATKEHRPLATNFHSEHAMFKCRLSGQRAVSRLLTNTPDADVGQRLDDKDCAEGRNRRSYGNER